MFKQGKKSTPLAITSGTLLFTLMAAPNASVVTNAVKENKGNSISSSTWWIFTIGTFGLYAIYWYFFKGSPEKPPVAKEINKDINVGTKNENLSSSNTKSQVRLNNEDNKINGSENEQVANNLKILIEKTKNTLQKAYSEKKQIEYIMGGLNSDITKYSIKVKTLPHQMVLDFNKKAKKFNEKINDYKKEIKKYKEGKMKKIEQKLMKRKKKHSEKLDEVTFFDLSKYENSIYKFMEVFEKEVLESIETIDESVLDENLNYEDMKRKHDNIDYFCQKSMDLPDFFGEVSREKSSVFYGIERKKAEENKKSFQEYEKLLQKAKLDYDDNEKALNIIDKKIYELEESLKFYEEQLKSYEAKSINDSINQENVDTISND